MKQILLTLFLLLLPLGLRAGGEQDFASYFMANYAKGTSLTCSTVSPLMMEKMLQLPEANEDADMKPILEKLKSIRFAVNADKGETPRLFTLANEVAERNAKRYKPWAVDDTKHIYIRKRGQVIVEVVLVMTRDELFHLVNLTGNLDEKLMMRLLHV